MLMSVNSRTARPILMATVAAVISLQQVGHAADFPIGAWWPGMRTTEASTFARKFAQLDSAYFNTVHAACEAYPELPVANDTLLSTAVDSGFAVQLYSWYNPGGWKNDKLYWAKTIEAEDVIFDHYTGVASGDSAWAAFTSTHSAGLMLDNDEEGIYLKGDTLDYYGCYGRHHFRMKTNYIGGGLALDTLRVLRYSTGAVLDSLVVYPMDFDSVNVWQDFTIVEGVVSRAVCLSDSRIL